jgi:hypothetical protein
LLSLLWQQQPTPLLRLELLLLLSLPQAQAHGTAVCATYTVLALRDASPPRPPPRTSGAM